MQQTALKFEPKYLTSNSKNTESLAKNCTNMELPWASKLKKKLSNLHLLLLGEERSSVNRKKSNSYLFKLIIAILCNAYFKKRREMPL